MNRLESEIAEAMHTNDWERVAELQTQLGTPLPPIPPSIVSAALFYAEIGLKVFPLQPHSKMPHRGTRGLKEATTDRDTIIQWWTKWPASNVAIATGHQVDVIDVDGPLGVHSWAQAENMPQPIGTVSTPRNGGTHLYITATGKGNKAGIFPGIDYRGQGGYVVAPPSINAEGVVYRWRQPLRLQEAK